MVVSVDDLGYNGKFKAVHVAQYTFYISYNTIVAFREPKEGLQVCTNLWSNTTGKHIAYLGVPPKERLSSREFDARLNVVMDDINRKLQHDTVIELDFIETDEEQTQLPELNL